MIKSHWKVLFPLGLGTALSLMGDSTLYTVLPTHTTEAGIALASVGVMLGVNRAVRVLLNGPVGLLCDHWPRRWIFVPALFIGAFSTAVYAATRGFWPLLVGRLLWGLAWSGIWVGGTTVILDVTTPQDRGRWMGLYQTWFFMGAALGTFLGGLLTDRLGYAQAMWVGAALTGLGGLVALFLLPETRLPVQASDRYFEDERDVKESLSPLRANTSLWLVAALQGVNRFVIAGVLLATTGLLVQHHFQLVDFSVGVATLTGLLLAGRTALSMASAPLAGTASDWLGSRWSVLLWGLFAGAASMLLVAWETPFAILAGIALGAIASGGIQSLTATLAGDLVSQEQRGRAIGVLHTAGDIGSALGPPVAYALLPWAGLRGAYVLCAILFALQSAWVLRFLWHKQACAAGLT